MYGNKGEVKERKRLGKESKCYERVGSSEKGSGKGEEGKKGKNNGKGRREWREEE